LNLSISEREACRTNNGKGVLTNFIQSIFRYGITFNETTGKIFAGCTFASATNEHQIK
jgi:hypothetical protein